MNAYFKTLADLLPPHQEGRKRNKVDILIHASKYIKDLHSRTEELFSTHASEAHSMCFNACMVSPEEQTFYFLNFIVKICPVELYIVLVFQRKN